MTGLIDCAQDWQHDLYSCPRWLNLLAGGGRGPAFEVRTEHARLPVHTVSPTSNPRYTAGHLLREVSQAPHQLWFAGPMSGYRTAPQHRRDERAGSPVDEALLAAAERAARSGSSLVAPFLPAYLVPGPAAGGLLLFEEHEYWLRPAASFEEYLVDFTPHRRTAARHELRTFQTAGAELVLLALAEQLTAFAALTVSDSLRRGEQADLDGMIAFLERIAATFGKDAVLIAAVLDGRLAGAALGIRHWDTLWLRMTGLHRDLEGSFAYFVLTYYAASLLHEELGADTVHLGVGAAEAKRRRGARAEPLYTWISDAATAGLPLDAADSRLAAGSRLVGTRSACPR